MSGDRSLDASKICFIACVNDEAQFEQFCLAGLRRLVVPEGMSIEVLTVGDAASMTAGYEEARLASDAKYKVYLHQDVEIVNPDFIRDLLGIFSREPSVGIVGMIGVSCLCSNGVWWDSLARGVKGGVCCTRDGKPKADLNFCAETGTEEKPYEIVEAVDGLLLATQYDIPWRDDIIGNYHYYDISQCLEYRRQGYQAAVPRQESYWVIHHERDKKTYSWLYDWDIQRKKCLNEYWPELLPEASGKEKQVEILVIDSTEWEGAGKYDYLRELIVPEGYGLNITITKGSWKARDYREFQEDRPAKYHIYIAEGTKIVNRNFLPELLAAFDLSDRIGCIGVAGRNCRSAQDLVEIWDGSPWQMGVPMVPVDMIDGGFIATQYPVLWDDVRYCGDSFVTEAACLDLARRGCLSMVVRQEPGREWVRQESGGVGTVSSVTLDNICKEAGIVSEKAIRLMRERAVINFWDCDTGEIFRREYEPDWGRIDKRRPENRLAETPLVSVVMPVWKAEKYIGAAIESVLAQTCGNFELLLVEDCPTDNTPAVVAAYAKRDRRLRVLKNDRNRGISYTTNRAIAEAKGKYIALLDDDDLMTPWRLELQAAYLEEHPEIDILGGCTVNIYENGGLANRWYVPPRLGAIHANLLLNMGGFANGTGMIRRDFIVKNRLRYRDNACGMQDMKFYMDASPLGRFDAIPDVLLYSRQHGGQETRAAFDGERARRRATVYAQFQRESLAGWGIHLTPACLMLLNRICDEGHLAVCQDERELRQFTAVIEEIYRQAAARKLWFLEEAGACLASRVWEQCRKLGVKEPPKVTAADLPG